MDMQNEERHLEEIVSLSLLRCRAGQSKQDACIGRWKRLKAKLERDPKKMKKFLKDDIFKELDWLGEDFYPGTCGKMLHLLCRFVLY
jgi:hypothetical protein